MSFPALNTMWLKKHRLSFSVMHHADILSWQPVSHFLLSIMWRIWCYGSEFIFICLSSSYQIYMSMCGKGQWEGIHFSPLWFFFFFLFNFSFHGVYSLLFSFFLLLPFPFNSSLIHFYFLSCFFNFSFSYVFPFSLFCSWISFSFFCSFLFLFYLVFLFPLILLFFLFVFSLILMSFPF